MNANQILTEANLHKSHWGEIIIGAEELGRFLLRNYREAGEWQTCACGMQDKKIPRHDYNGYTYKKGEPIDRRLSEFGQTFFHAVANNNFPLAAKRLIRIENRAKKILAKL